jgi:hypothetical protein
MCDGCARVPLPACELRGHELRGVRGARRSSTVKGAAGGRGAGTGARAHTRSRPHLAV